MTMAIIVAQTNMEAKKFADNAGYRSHEYKVVTPNQTSGRGVTATDLHIVGKPQFKSGQLDCLVSCFIHSRESLDIWDSTVSALQGLSTQ